jgi:RNA polymerase sigma-70 factor (ECF subfamily)
MQRGEDSRVSEPVLETLEIPRAVTRVASSDWIVRANVEIDAARAYEEHAPRLRAFAIAAVRDGEAADDVVQEAFLRLVVELKAGRPPDNVGGWLYRTSANLIISRGRRRSVADRMRAFLVRRDVEPSPEDHALRSERDRTLAQALSKLPPDARVALLLAARGMGSTEIGLVIHRSPAATRTYLCRARLRLRDELAALGMRSEP